MSDFSKDAMGYCRRCRCRVAMDDGPECNCPEPVTPPDCGECGEAMELNGDGYWCPDCEEG